MSNASAPHSYNGDNASSCASTPASLDGGTDLHYKVPTWLENHIRTVEELKVIEPRIWVSDNASDCGTTSTASSDHSLAHREYQHGQKPREDCFVINQDEIDDLLDSIASLHLPDPRRLASGRQCTIALHTQMRHGYHFLDELVYKMGKEMECHVLSLSPYELHEIAVDFKDQEGSATASGSTEVAGANQGEDIVPKLELTEKTIAQIFGARSSKNAEEAETRKSHNVIATLLDAVKAKMSISTKEQPSDESSEHQVPPESAMTEEPDLLVYLRDFSGLDTKLASRIICRIRDVIIARRQTGQRVTLILGSAHVDSCDDEEYCDKDKPWLRSHCECVPCVCVTGHRCTCDVYYCPFRVFDKKLEASSLFLHSITPIDVPKTWGSTSVIDWPSSRMGSRIRMLQRRLFRHLGQLPSSPASLLSEDGSRISALSEASKLIFASGHVWPWTEEVEALYSRVLGRCLRRRHVDLVEIDGILRHGRNRDTPAPVDRDGNAEAISEKEQAQKQWQDDLAAIGRTCTAEELRLFSNIINPAAFSTTMNEVVLDQDVITRMTNIVKLSKMKLGTTSEALLSQVRGAGALLYGPPGTGKTHLVRAVARSTGSKHLIMVDAATVNNQYLGETEKAIAAIFSLASKLYPCIIFLDEVDALFYRRSGEDKSWQRANITQFLQSMDGLLNQDNSAFLIAATNRPTDLDTAFLRRLPHRIAFELPDESARSQILGLFLSKEDLDGVSLNTLAAATEGFSGSDLKSLCGQAALIWASERENDAEEDSEGCKILLTMDHFDKALSNTRPTVSQTDLYEMRRFQQRYNLQLKRSLPTGRSPAAVNGKEPASSSKAKGSEPQQTNQAEPKELTEQEVLTSLEVNIVSPGPESDELQPTSTPLTHENSQIMPIINPPDDYEAAERLSYPYNALPSATSIRLLKVFTSDSTGFRQRGDDVLCSMIVVDLENNPDYFALSYTWGDPRTLYLDETDKLPAKSWAAQAFTLLCDGHAVLIGTNLYTALISIKSSLGDGTYAQKLGERFKTQDPTSFYIWIDALCINQDDLREKSGQIPLMGRIYTQARCTLMWLGGSEPLLRQGYETTQKRLESIIDMMGSGEGIDELTKLQTESKFEITSSNEYRQLGLQPLTKQEILGWYLFTSRSWFKRVWVMQEWILSRHAAFICGELLVDPLVYILRLASFQSRGWISQMQHMVMENLWGSEGEHQAALDKAVLVEGSNDLLSRTLAAKPPQRRHADLPWIYRANVEYDIHGDLDTAHLSALMLRRMIDVREGEAVEQSEACTPQKSVHRIRSIYHITISDFRGLRCFDPRDKVYAFHDLYRTRGGDFIFPKPDYLKPVREVYIEASKIMVEEIGARFLCFREERAYNPDGFPSWVPDLRVDGPQIEAGSKWFSAAAGMRGSDTVVNPGHILIVSGQKVDTITKHSPYYVYGPGSRHTDYRKLWEVMADIPEVCSISTALKSFEDSTNDDSSAGLGGEFKALEKEVDNKGQPQKVLQSRLEVLWRTLHEDNLYDVHPLPESFNIAHLARMAFDLEKQYQEMVWGNVYAYLASLSEEGRVQPPDPMESEHRHISEADPEGYLCCTCLLKDLVRSLPQRQAPTSEQLQAARNRVFETYTTITKLQGGLPADAPTSTPSFWPQYEELWEAFLAAYNDRDLSLIYKSLENLYELIDPGQTPESGKPPDLPSRRLTILATEKDRLGSTRGLIEDGDEIWILAGVYTPIVLRRVGGGRYIMVACVYVHGVMHGEAVRHNEDVLQVKIV